MKWILYQYYSSMFFTNKFFKNAVDATTQFRIERSLVANRITTRQQRNLLSEPLSYITAFASFHLRQRSLNLCPID